MHKIRMIAAIDDKRGLARSGRIPWRLPTDTAYYINKTKNSMIALGKNTYRQMGPDLLAERYKHVYVLSNEPINVPNGEVVTDVPALVGSLSEDLWILGSGGVYVQFLEFADEIYLTRVSGDFGCDIFFPEFESKFELTHDEPELTENGINFKFQIWSKRV